MKTILKILVCLVLMISTIQCSVEADDLNAKASEEVDRRLSTLTPEALHDAICRLAALSNDYSVTGLRKLGETNDDIAEEYGFKVGKSSVIIIRKFKNKGIMQGGWKGDPVITAIMYEDDLQLDKENYSAFRNIVEGSSMMAILYHLMGKDEYNRNFEGLIKNIKFVNDEMNYSDNLSHGYMVAGRGIYVFDSKKNVIATVWPHTQWNVSKEGKRYLFFVVGVYPGQLLE